MLFIVNNTNRNDRTSKFRISFFFLFLLSVVIISAISGLLNNQEYGSNEAGYSPYRYVSEYEKRSAGSDNNENLVFRGKFIFYSYGTVIPFFNPDQFWFNNVTSSLNDTLKDQESEKYLQKLKSDKFIGGRTARWYYGWVVFKEYPWHKKVFGGGFNYLEKFGRQFGEAKYDWPHNPMISAFLYSGIIGGMAFIWFMIMVVVNYIIYLKYHKFFFISFMVTFFFVFFSDTSLFNTPLFTFLCVIPFFTKYIILKEAYSDSEKIPLKKILFW